MNKFLQRVFLALAVLTAGFGVLVAVSFHLQGIGLLGTKSVGWSVALVVFFLVVAFGLKKEWKFRVFLVLCMLAMVELALQTAALVGVLPGVNTNQRAPYARVYWTAEGRGNGVRNRFGWYYPEFDLQAPRRIVLIGDSQVDAVQVRRDRNQSWLLQQKLKQASPDWAVLGMGMYGLAPSYYLEVLEYAQRHFQPREAIICLSMGSDISETSPALNGESDNYIYYDLDENGQLKLTPAREQHRILWDGCLELCHRPFYWWLPTLVKSHCLTVQSYLSVRDSLHRRRLAAARAAKAQAMKGAAGRDFAELGFNPAPFATNQSPEVRLAMRTLKRELERAKEISDTNGMQLRIVTIPVFPTQFYETQKGRDWTVKIGDYDFLGPERELAAWAREKNVPLLALGECIQEKKLNVEEIRSLYFSHGTGHLTEQGHRFCADAIYEAFYAARK